MNAGQVKEVLTTYRKYGWNLHRVLLTDTLRKKLSESTKDLFADSDIVSAVVDAAWFTRDSGKDRTAWELRHLDTTPFALFESVEKDMSEEECEEIKAEMEMRLANLITKRNN